MTRPSEAVSPAIVLDFTINQIVYETLRLPDSLLKWRIQIGQEMQVILPSFRVGDTWKIRSIFERDGWLSPVKESDAIAPSCVGNEELYEIDAQPIVARGPLEYPGLSFTFVARKSGKAVIQLFQSNPVHGGPSKIYNLELTVLSC